MAQNQQLGLFGQYLTVNSSSNVVSINTASVNAVSYTIGTALTANATLVNAAAINITGQTNTATLYVTTSANVGTYFTVNSSAAVKAVNASFTGANLYVTGTNTYITANTLLGGLLTTTSNTVTFGTAAYHVANGNLGLGTASPAATLDVVGTVNTSKANTLNQTLTDGATISWDTSLGQVATVTLAGNRTMAAPTNLKVQTYILHVLQDATGSRTLTWNAVFKWPAGVAPTLTTTASARDIFSFVSDGTNLYGSFLPNVK